MKFLPTCLEVSTALARGEDAGPLARLHLLICGHCRKFKRQLGLIAAALRERVFETPDAARAAALEKAVLARLRR